MTVYILYSKEIDRYYVGQSENLANRLDQHIKKILPGSYTQIAKDWTVYFTIECNSRKQAVNIEAHIKRMKAREYFEDIRKYSELSERLKLKYQ